MPENEEIIAARREAFSAAHQLGKPDLSDEENQRVFGKCWNLHGHNYTIEVEVSGQLDPVTGYVCDLSQLSDLIHREIIDHVDHRNLNVDVPWLSGCNPTAEILARVFFSRLAGHLPAGSLRSVRLWETDKNWAECRQHA